MQGLLRDELGALLTNLQAKDEHSYLVASAPTVGAADANATESSALAEVPGDTMNFSTIRQRLEAGNGNYATDGHAAFARDIDLLVNECLRRNKVDSKEYAFAEQFKEEAHQMIERSMAAYSSSCTSLSDAAMSPLKDQANQAVDVMLERAEEEEEEGSCSSDKPSSKSKKSKAIPVKKAVPVEKRPPADRIKRSKSVETTGKIGGLVSFGKPFTCKFLIKSERFGFDITYIEDSSSSRIANGFVVLMPRGLLPDR